MEKFNRNYILTVETIDGREVTILPPLTLEFDITRKIYGSANDSVITVYNLGEKTRDNIRKNSWDTGDIRNVRLRAGYGDNLPTVFVGNITQCWSGRSKTNFLTEIISFDAGFAFATATLSQEFPEGTSRRTILENFVDSLQSAGISKGKIGDYPGEITRGNSFSGSTTEILRELSGGGFYIDNGVANVLRDNEVLQGELTVITAETGLLNVQMLRQSVVTVEILFEPRIIVGQFVQVRSDDSKFLNDDYKVVGVNHRGTISEAVAGDATTVLELQAISDPIFV